MATEAPALPSIQDLAAKMSGGTSSDPNIPPQGEKVVELVVVAETEEVTAPAVAAEEAKEEPKEVKTPDKTASRFAALTRKEKEIREKTASTDRRVKELELREKALQDRDSGWKRIKDDPIGALKDAGLSYAEITAAMMGQYKKPEEDPLDTRFKPVNDKLSSTETTIAKLQQEIEDLRNQSANREHQEQYNLVMGKIQEAAKDTDKYELIHTMGPEGIDLVRDTMIEYFQQHKEMLDYSRACDMVEKYYEDTLLGPVSNTKKLKAKLGVSEASKTPPAVLNTKLPTEKKSKEPASTLTNKLATAAQANIDIDKLPKKEALAELAKRLVYK